VTLRRDWIGSPNYSSRGSGVRLVVLHTAEGALTYQSLGSFFSSSSSGVSSHVGIDDTPGVIGEYVRRDLKAWTQGNANPYSVAAELCAFAAWTGEWAQHPTMLETTAAWVAEECAAFNIPIRRLSPAEAQGGAAGVCQHVDLGAAGGGHWDCGPGFPMEQVIEMAAGGAAPSPPDESEAANMVLLDERSGGYWVAFSDGAVHAYDGAPFLGGTNNDRYNAGHKPCVGIAGRLEADGGYCLVVDFGNRDCRRYEFPYDGSARV
jgi:hypothetical protein